MSFSSAQCRAARALLDWSQGVLAESSGIARATVAEFETGRRKPIANNLAAMRTAFEAAGVTFLEEGATTAGGPGVRLTSGELPTGSAKHPAEGNDNEDAGEQDERREAND